MPLFGRSDDEPGDGPALDAEIARITSLSLAQLAAELMLKGFGPDGPGAPGVPGTLEAPSAEATRVGVSDIARRFTPAYTGRGVSTEQQLRFTALLEEGLQALEHASLIRIRWQGGMQNCIATRLGRSALAENSVERLVGGASSAA